MRLKPVRKVLDLQTFGMSRLVRIVTYTERARSFVQELTEFGRLELEGRAKHIFQLEVDGAYDQIEVEAYIRSFAEDEEAQLRQAQEEELRQAREDARQQAAA
jgi:hypothetical protein